ncbi:MAG: hypothetical protein KF726_27180 [Anaerolineae bacterium]|nr:hypothetical protein [Anaerolineae bacterium]
MGVDYVIDYDCVPKRTLTTMGLLSRLKAQTRAEAIIKLYRDNGDMRPPSEMGFEMVRRTPDGEEETQVIVIQDLLDEAAGLDQYKPYCPNCPANVLKRPFGCFNAVNYPISQKAELWLLKRLPTPDEPLVFLLAQQAIQDLQISANISEQIAVMRQRAGVYFQSNEVLGRRYDEMTITTNHIFQLLFLAESIQPAYAVLLMLLFGVIPRDMDAEGLMALTTGARDQALPLLIEPEADDDESIHALKSYFTVLHRAHSLNVSVSLDA